jgi:hypothetical protein
VTRATSADRWRTARWLLLVFVACWAVVALLYLIPVTDGAITLGGWASGMAMAPIAPMRAVLIGDTSIPLAFMVPFALGPLALAAVAIWRARDERWFRAAAGVFVL